MILHRLAILGLHAFPDREVTIDFDALPSLIAVSGPNGAGKTTALEAICGATHLVMPSRPHALWKNFARAGHIILDWSLGSARYQSVVRCDPDAERTEATLFAVNTDGNAGAVVGDVVAPGIVVPDAQVALAGPLVRDYVRATTGLLGPIEALLASMFSIQSGAGAFLRCSRAERRALLSDWLGLARYATYHEAAKRRAKDVDQALVGLRAKEAALSPVAAGRGLLEERQQALAAELDVAEGKARAAQTALQDAIETAAKVKADRAALDSLAAVQSAHAAELAHQTAVSAYQRAEERRATLTRQSDLLDTVPCKGQAEFAGCSFLADAVAARAALPGIQSVTPEPNAPRRLTDPVPALQVRRTALQRELTGLEGLVGQTGPLEAAEARLEELGRALAEAHADLAAKDADLARLDADLARIPALEEQVRNAQQAVRAAEEARGYAAKDVQRVTHERGQLEAQLTAAVAAERDLAEVREGIAPLVDDAADWALLGRAFSPNGIPALLVDRSLPEIGALATDLLRECFGSAVFAISLTTQRESAAGDKLLETLDVLVTRDGEAIDAGLLSGGESVLVSEALSLALCLYNATRSGRRIGALIRDEVGAALDIDRAPAYAALLRRAAQLGGFRHVLYVSHNERALDLADVRLEVHDGAVAVA